MTMTVYVCSPSLRCFLLSTYLESLNRNNIVVGEIQHLQMMQFAHLEHPDELIVSYRELQ